MSFHSLMMDKPRAGELMGWWDLTLNGLRLRGGHWFSFCSNAVIIPDGLWWQSFHSLAHQMLSPPRERKPQLDGFLPVQWEGQHVLPAISLPKTCFIYFGAHLISKMAGRPAFSSRTGAAGYGKLFEHLLGRGPTMVQGEVKTVMPAPTLPSWVFTSANLVDPVRFRAGGRPLHLSEADPTRSSIDKGMAKYLNGIYRLHMHLWILNLLIKWSSLFSSATQCGFLWLSWKFLTYSMNLSSFHTEFSYLLMCSFFCRFWLFPYFSLQGSWHMSYTGSCLVEDVIFALCKFLSSAFESTPFDCYALENSSDIF